MKRLILFSAGLIATLSLGQQYSVERSTIGGGGGTSAGGDYSVQGTVGQPCTGKASGGDYAVNGGFWSAITAVQVPGAPRLTITRTNSNIVVSWPVTAADWRLEQNNSLTGPPGAWTLVTAPYLTNASTIHVTVPSLPGSLFFRLRGQ